MSLKNLSLEKYHFKFKKTHTHTYHACALVRPFCEQSLQIRPDNTTRKDYIVFGPPSIYYVDGILPPNF
jgi:hypothetical protein